MNVIKRKFEDQQQGSSNDDKRKKITNDDGNESNNSDWASLPYPVIHIIAKLDLTSRNDFAL